MRLIDSDEAIINFGFEWDDISPTRDEFYKKEANKWWRVTRIGNAKMESEGE